MFSTKHREMAGHARGLEIDLVGSVCASCQGECYRVKVFMLVEPGLGIERLTLLWRDHCTEHEGYTLAARATTAWASVQTKRLTKAWLLEVQEELDLGL